MSDYLAAIDWERHGTLKLYKYVSQIALDGLLSHGDLKIGYGKSTNDPYELCPYGILPPNNESDLGFISFTTKPRNHPMWGNYADSYKGACLEFKIGYFLAPQGGEDEQNKDKLQGEELVQSCIRMENMGRRPYIIQCPKDTSEAVDLFGGDAIVACYYTNDRPQNITVSDIIQKPETDEDALEFAEKVWRWLATKHNDWRYEDEYRALIGEKHISRVVLHPTEMKFASYLTRYISKIILGPCCPWDEDDIKNMIELHRKTHSDDVYLPETVEVVKAKFTEKTYDLYIPSSLR